MLQNVKMMVPLMQAWWNLNINCPKYIDGDIDIVENKLQLKRKWRVVTEYQTLQFLARLWAQYLIAPEVKT